jgi:hypothetical protein
MAEATPRRSPDTFQQSRDRFLEYFVAGTAAIATGLIWHAAYQDVYITTIAATGAFTAMKLFTRFVNARDRNH